MEQELQAAEPKAVSLLTIFLVFLKVGAFTFGGGYAMLPIIQGEVVDRREWVDENLFIDIIVLAQSLPGAIALNSAIQIGTPARNLGRSAGGTGDNRPLSCGHLNAGRLFPSCSPG